jgi:hypothetical protein
MERQLTKATVVTGIFTGGTGSIEMNLADTTDIVFGKIPSPSRNSIPLRDLDLHCCEICKMWKV